MLNFIITVRSSNNYTFLATHNYLIYCTMGKIHRYTNASWIAEAKKKHTCTKYNYSKVKYINSRSKVIIICPIHGEFIQAPDRHLSGSGCLLCGNKNSLLNRKILLENSFATHKKAKYWSPKNVLKPDNVTKCSGKKMYFDCKCGHEIYAQISHVQNGKWCPYCSLPPRKLCSDSECTACYDKSFASHPKACHWSDENIVAPRLVFKSCNTKYLFDCNVCYHSFEVAPGSITSSNAWCPYCVNQLLCSDKDCDFCFKNSFASAKKAKFWSDKNKLTARQVFKSSSNKYYFNCRKCKHEIHMRLLDITKNKHWCSYCANQLLCSNYGCTRCFYKSFLSCNMSVYWSKKNIITPREAFLSSGKKYIFNYKYCNNEYECALYSIVAGSWCNCRKNKTETKLRTWLNKSNFIVTPQQSYNWCKNEETKRHLPFDFVIESLKIIIELDGPQHFKQVSNWKGPEDTIKLDIYKMNQAIKNGYTVIRLLQEDVWNNKNDWIQKLKECIDTHSLNNKSYYFLCANNEYDNHERLLNIITPGAITNINIKKPQKEPVKTIARKSIVKTN